MSKSSFYLVAFNFKLISSYVLYSVLYPVLLWISQEIKTEVMQCVCVCVCSVCVKQYQLVLCMKKISIKRCACNIKQPAIWNSINLSFCSKEHLPKIEINVYLCILDVSYL